MKIASSAIEELILNNGIYFENIKPTEEYNRASAKSIELNNKLTAMLNEEQNKILDNLIWAYMEMEALNTDNYFTEGVKAGIRLAAECFLC